MYFITNFSNSKEYFYTRAAELTATKIEIRDNAYDVSGKLVEGYKALYTDNQDLSVFWNKFWELAGFDERNPAAD